MIEEIRAISLSRFFNKKLLGNKKAEVIVCGFKNFGFAIETKCEECGRLCYYSDDNKDLKIRNPKKICTICILKNHREEIDGRIIKILERLNRNGRNG